jgi:hypothetical protein
MASRWMEIVTEQLRAAGPTRADKREAFRRAKAIYHGERSAPMGHNPSGGKKLLTLLIVGGVGLVGYQALRKAQTPPPNPYAQPLYPTGAIPANSPT